MIKMIFNMKSGLTREFIGYGYEIPDSADDGVWVRILDEDDDPIALIAIDDISTIEIEYVEETKEEEEETPMCEHTINPARGIQYNPITGDWKYPRF